MNWGTVIKKPGEAEAKPPAPEPRPKLPAWSYSRFAKWSKCPLSAYYAFILKMPEPASEAMERGTRLHAEAASILNGIPDKRNELSVPWAARLEATRSCYSSDVETELQIAFRLDWTQTDWFAKDAWCRVIFDAMIVQPGTGVVMVQEHKSGKPRAEHTQQATLYAAAAAALVPNRAVEVTINYLDLNPEGPQGVVRHHFPADLALKQTFAWAERVQPMMNDTDYPATPGNHCRWCSFAASKGGPCEKA
jgi:hypothetical protein